MCACVCQCIWEYVHSVDVNTHKYRQTPTSIRSDFQVTEDCRCSSLTLKVAVDTKRHSVGGLMDQRPADLECFSEYWSAPNTDGRSVCVCVCVCMSVCERERERERERGALWEGDTCVWQSVSQRTQQRGKREQQGYACQSHILCAQLSMRLCIYLRLLISCSLLASQRCAI